ncbi:DegT/DnrJ/EryC1/StrS family aminotransferase, partial [Microvirga sp. 3-52]|nr:DegT/DnrJ/EryC1/StrS family aminotransferase [Microvirga sp. 3-52]
VLKLVEVERLARHKIKKQYELRLAKLPGIRVLTTLEGVESSYQYFVIEIDEGEFGHSRDTIHEKLKGYSVFTRKYFYPLCSDFHWYSHLASARPQNLPQAQK